MGRSPGGTTPGRAETEREKTLGGFVEIDEEVEKSTNWNSWRSSIILKYERERGLYFDTDFFL
jgi:hypothetical protein